MDDDVERQVPHHGAKKISRECWIRCICVAIVIVIVVVVGVCVGVRLQYFRVDTRYSIAIDSSSGLDPTAGISFNLTLGVASRSHGAKACVKPDMYLEVFYRGVLLAVSQAQTRQTCAGPRRTAEVPILAWAAGVPEGHVLDSLAAEMRHGTAVFDVRLHVPAGSYGGYPGMDPWVTGCMGSRVGHAAVSCDCPDQSH